MGYNIRGHRFTDICLTKTKSELQGGWSRFLGSRPYPNFPQNFLFCYFF